MADSFLIKQGDNWPELRRHLLDANKQPIRGLDEYDIQFIMKSGQTGAEKVNAPAELLDETTAEVVYRWAALDPQGNCPDTDTHGSFQGEWECTKKDGTRKFTVPTGENIAITIVDDVGNKK